MPVPAQVGCILGYADHVAESFGDVAVAPGADVGLACFIGLNASHLDGAIQPVPHAHPKKAQATIAAMITRAEPTIRKSL